MRRATILSAGMAAILAFAGSATAQTAAPSPAAPAPSLAEWDAFTDQLHQLGDQMLAKLPDRLRNDPQTRQEIGRLMLEALAANTLQAISADPDHPVFLPALNVTLNVTQPNSDTVYKAAEIGAGGVYRLRGERGSLRLLKMGQFGPAPNAAGGAIIALGYDDFNALHLDAAGRFDVILSPTRPAGYTGDWWPLNPAATRLVLRQVAFDWAERDPTLSIERLDKSVERPRPDAADLSARLSRLGAATAVTATFFVDHVEALRRDGYINRLKVFDVSQLGALAGQFYYEGAYDLKPDEALIVEAKVPATCGYWSMILTNEIYETTDWYNNESSLNGTQARVDSDGYVRMVVSAKDPGVPNWLDTAGYPSGAIQGRWTDCSAQPVPTVRKVALADVRGALPADTPTVTPAQRDQIIRDRRAQAQQRPLW